MARKRTESSDTQTETIGGGQEGHGIAPSTISKADAARAILDEGIESPVQGVAEIMNRFGIEMTRGHFSAEKARYVQRQGGPKIVVKRGRPVKGTSPRLAPKPLVEGYLAPPPRPRDAAPAPESELLAAMEQMKPLVSSLGAEKLKRIVDLLG